LVARSLAHGFIDLVSAPWAPIDEISWPPIIQRRLTGAAGVQLAETSVPAAVILPECLRMDARRIKNFHAEVIDLTITHSILVALKTIVTDVRPHIAPDEMAKIVAYAKSDVIEMSDDFGRINLDGQDGVSDLAIRLASRVWNTRKTECCTIERARSVAKTAEMLDRALQDIKMAKGIYARGEEDVKEILERMLGDLLLNIEESNGLRGVEAGVDEVGEVSVQGGVDIGRKECMDQLFRRCGLAGCEDGIAPDLKELAKKMERIVGFNLKCFGAIYAGKGMVVGL
jgi:hypothetical protein